MLRMFGDEKVKGFFLCVHHAHDVDIDCVSEHALEEGMHEIGGKYLHESQMRVSPPNIIKGIVVCMMQVFL